RRHDRNLRVFPQHIGVEGAFWASVRQLSDQRLLQGGRRRQQREQRQRGRKKRRGRRIAVQLRPSVRRDLRCISSLLFGEEPRHLYYLQYQQSGLLQHVSRRGP